MKFFYGGLHFDDFEKKDTDKLAEKILENVREKLDLSSNSKFPNLVMFMPPAILSGPTRHPPLGLDGVAGLLAFLPPKPSQSKRNETFLWWPAF
jgi:hypothetical protein